MGFDSERLRGAAHDRAGRRPRRVPAGDGGLSRSAAARCAACPASPPPAPSPPCRRCRSPMAATGSKAGRGRTNSGWPRPQALFTVITPGYFDALRVAVVRGRDVGDGDRLDAPFVAVVNEQLVKDAVPRRRSDRPHHPRRPRQPHADDHRRHREGHPHARPGPAGAGRDLLPVRTASRTGHGAEPRGARRRRRAAGRRRGGGQRWCGRVMPKCRCGSSR